MLKESDKYKLYRAVLLTLKREHISKDYAKGLYKCFSIIIDNGKQIDMSQSIADIFATFAVDNYSFLDPTDEKLLLVKGYSLQKGYLYDMADDKVYRTPSCYLEKGVG